MAKQDDDKKHSEDVERKVKQISKETAEDLKKLREKQLRDNETVRK